MMPNCGAGPRRHREQIRLQRAMNTGYHGGLGGSGFGATARVTAAGCAPQRKQDNCRENLQPNP